MHIPFKSVGFGLGLVLLTLSSIGLIPLSGQSSPAFPFTLQGSSLASCWYYGVGFSAAGGEQITAQWSEAPSPVGPVSVNFYIAKLTAVHQTWLCDQGPVNLYWNDGAYGTANWAVPSTGGYAVLVVNYSQYLVSGTISVTIVNATISATPIGPSPVRRALPNPSYSLHLLPP